MRRQKSKAAKKTLKQSQKLEKSMRLEYKEEESDENSKDESRHSNDTKEDESKDKTKEDNTSTLKDYESDVEDAKPKAKDNPKDIETTSNEDITNEREHTKTNENEQTNDEEQTKLKDYIPLEESETTKLNETKTKQDETIPKEIDTESLSSYDTEETSTITLNTEQLKKKRKKKQQKRAIRHRKKLKLLKTNEIRRILRMQIKTKLYKKFEVNAEPSEDEAESDDEYLQLKEDDELRIYRTQYLERIFHKKALLKINELIKLNESHQRPICDVKFDGTQTTLNSFWINLKMTAKSRGWTKFTKAFIVRSNNIARTVCVLENPSAMNNTEYRIWMKEREDHDYFSNERTNMYTAILNSITQTVRNRLNATAHDIKDGVELALWIHSTYSLQIDQKESALLNKITNLSIKKSRTMDAFFTYIESLASTDNELLNRYSRTLLDATKREMMSLTNNTSFIAVLQTLITKHDELKQDLNINDLLKAARTEYQSSKVNGRWLDHSPPKQAYRAPREYKEPRRYNVTDNKDAEIVALKAQLHQLSRAQQHHTPRKKSPRTFEPDYGPGKDFSTKEQFFDWKWSKPLKDGPVIKNRKIWHFCTKCNCWTFHPTNQCKLADGYVKQRPNVPLNARANVATINHRPWGNTIAQQGWRQNTNKQNNWGHTPNTKFSWGRSSNKRKPPVQDERGDNDAPNNSYGLKDFE